jgi:hypothetical protein
MPRLFAGTIFLAATLLFWVEPMAAKMVLPRFGGGPAVWTTCMLFFQAALLLGYGYAHLVSTRLAPRRQAPLHLGLVLLPLLVLPLAIPPSWTPPAEANPIGVLLGYLLLTVGLPFFVVSATTPLVQQWFAVSGSRHSADPYFLYAASNLGSALGLLSYPAVLEPSFGLRLQGWLWAGGYGVLAVLLAACALTVWRGTRAPAPSKPSGKTPATAHAVAAPPTWRARLHWVALAFVPSSLMLGVTSYFTTDIAPVPMLWVMPLGVYLVTFVLAFGRLPPALYRPLQAVLPALLLLLTLVMVTEWTETGQQYLAAMKVLIPLHLTVFFITALVLHGRLAQERPAPRFLTEYFFWVSLGGVLGGVFNAVVAPLLFRSTWEYPISLVLALLLAPSWRPPRDARRALWLDAGLVAVLLLVLLALSSSRRESGSVTAGWRYVALGIVCLAALPRPRRMGLCLAVLFVVHILEPLPGLVRLHQERNFFGVLTVFSYPHGEYNLFYHGKTNHGAQDRRSLAMRRLPLLYFYPTGPIGQTFRALQDERKRPVAVVGLGAGTLAAYGRRDQEFTFFEIDPAVERVARTYFTYLADSPAKCRVVLGDARLSMAHEPDGHYGLIVLDAFSSDAPPVHLLTVEAMRLYLRKLAGDGVIAVNITNSYVQLEPVLDGVARACRLQARVQLDKRISAAEARQGKKVSHWVLLAREPVHFGELAQSQRWQRLQGRKDVGVWTDDYSNLLRVLNWD